MISLSHTVIVVVVEVYHTMEYRVCAYLCAERILINYLIISFFRKTLHVFNV